MNDAICFYPGMLYAPGEVSVFLAGWRNNYMMRLSDGTHLDGKYYGLSRFLWRGASGRSGHAVDSAWQNFPFKPARWQSEELGGNIEQETLLHFPRPYSLGCLINHYQPSPAPNVTYFEATVPLDSSALPLLPYIYSDGTLPIKDGVARVVVMMALRDVENEELLADYSFVAFYSPLADTAASRPV